MQLNDKIQRLETEMQGLNYLNEKLREAVNN